MRLINVHSLAIHDFGDNPPPYAILSHRWEGAEITYGDYERWCRQRVTSEQGPASGTIELDFCSLESSRGLQKIQAFCDLIKSSGQRCVETGSSSSKEPLHWIWVDTCCIDKRSSSELSESINSMAAWYERSALCVVYLCDVEACAETIASKTELKRSEWFRRGWTLQELIFSPNVIFCNKNWTFLQGVSKDSLLMSRITGIPLHCLSGGKDLVFRESVAARMSWASRRTTTKVEDQAYCLMGLFGVHMPLLYGEGEGAFVRLQEQILARTNDESIFAWTRPPLPATRDSHEPYPCALIAGSPRCFRHSGQIKRFAQPQIGRFRLVSGSLLLTTEAVRFKNEDFGAYGISEHVVLLELHCFDGGGPDQLGSTCLLAMEQYEEARWRRVFPTSLGRELWDRLVQPIETASSIGKLPSQTYRVPWIHEGARDTAHEPSPPMPRDICGIKELLSGAVMQPLLSMDWNIIDSSLEQDWFMIDFNQIQDNFGDIPYPPFDEIA